MATQQYSNRTIRESLQYETGIRMTSASLRSMIDLTDSAGERTYQRWLNDTEAKPTMPKRVQMGLAAYLRASGMESSIEHVLPRLVISDEVEVRLRRVSHIIQRGRYNGPKRLRRLSAGDLDYIESGVFPENSIPLCAVSGPPYVSEDDIRELELFWLSSMSKKQVAFSYLNPIQPGNLGEYFGSIDISAVVHEFYRLPEYPIGYSDERWELMTRQWRQAQKRGRLFFDRPGLALKIVLPRVGSEQQGDAITGLELSLQWSNYYAGRATNHSLDAVIPGRPLPIESADTNFTYRDEWVKGMGQFDDSLANLLQVNGFIITTGDPGEPRIHIGVRGSGTATNAAEPETISWTPCISGAASQDDCEVGEGGVAYQPVKTIMREGSEEIWGRRTQPPGSRVTVRFLGLSRVYTFYEPFLFGHVELDCTSGELIQAFRSLPRDNYDIKDIVAFPLSQDHLLNFAKSISPLRNKSAQATVSVVLFMLYHEMRFWFPESALEMTSEFCDAISP